MENKVLVGIIIILLTGVIWVLFDSLSLRSEAWNTCMRHGYHTMESSADGYRCFGIKDGNSYSVLVGDLDE
jgi:hypothetical protein